MIHEIYRGEDEGAAFLSWGMSSPVSVEIDLNCNGVGGHLFHKCISIYLSGLLAPCIFLPSQHKCAFAAHEGWTKRPDDMIGL